jgi:acyl-CoA synthetase (AMP-forming)/AMP-acid ligase II
MKELVYPRLLLTAAARRSSRPAFVDDDGTAESLADHVDRSLRLAHTHRTQLRLGGTAPFAVLAGNSRHYVNLWHTAFLGGGVVCPLNTRLAPPEIAFILNDAEATTCYVDAEYAGVIDSIRGDLPRMGNVVLIGGGDAPHDLRYEELVAAGEPEVVDVDEDDLAVLMYTGGTTGLPKGVVHTQRAQTLNVYRMNVMFGYFSDPGCFMNVTPMFHAGGAMGTMGMPCSGGTTVVHRLFDPGRMLAEMPVQGVTHLGLVPTMIGMLLNHPDYTPDAFRTVRVLGYGASPMPQAILERLLAELPHVDLVQTYGMTEAAAVLTALFPADHRRGGPILRSAGRPLPGVAVRIEDADGKVVPNGEVGEVCAQAGSFMVEYLKREPETAEAFRGGWYHSGDAGYLDDDGYVYLVDRTKDMIVTGAENVYSVEVENAISTHPAVLQVAVIGIPSERWGEQVHAIVVTKPGTSVTEEEIIAHARERIAGYKVPKSVEVRTDPLPLSGAMKVLKRELRRPYWEGRDRAID